MKQALHCVVCTLLTLALMVACVRYVSDSWLFSFVFSFQVHMTMALLVATAVALALFRSRCTLILTLAAALVTAHAVFMYHEFLTDPAQEVPANAPRFRLMSLNVLGDNLDNAESIAETVRESGADVVYLLEARPLTDWFDSLSAVYPYRIGCGILTDTCDLVVLSKHPMIRQNFATLSDLRTHRYAIIRIEIDGRPVRFSAVHLSKPYFDEYHSMELNTVYYNTWTIDGPFVVGGDFNSSSLAPDMQQFLRMRNLRAGDREPATWPTRAGRFGIPIDHVFATPDVLIQSVRPVVTKGSNHFGLVADMVLLPERQSTP